MSIPSRALACLVSAAAGLFGPGAQAQPASSAPAVGSVSEAPTVSLHGIVGNRLAVLLIGRQTHSVSVGERVAGVRLVSLQDNRAVVEIDGRSWTLRLGEQQARIEDPRGPAPSGVGANRELSLVADAGGHFIESCHLNDRATRCLVDTGATLVTLSQQQAEQLGLRYRDGDAVRTQTANGTVGGWRITLRKVRLGTVEVQQVEAVVLPGALEHVLLGNSFLKHFQFSRQDNVLRLQRKP